MRVNASVSLGFLAGDVSNSQAVNAIDITAVKARTGATVDQANFIFDVDASGTIDLHDVSVAKARSRSILP